MTSGLTFRLLCGLILLTQESQCCPDGFTEMNRLCLAFQRNPKNWDDANRICTGTQGHLAKAVDPESQEVIVDFRMAQVVRGTPVWMGMRTNNGHWQWHDGTPITWSAWKDGTAPASSGSNMCGYLDEPTSKWGSFPSCALPLPFICQYSIDYQKTRTKIYKSQLWHLEAKGRYSGTNSLMRVTLPSRLSCVRQCQSTGTCEAISFHQQTFTCHLIADGFSANQITAAGDWELWVKEKTALSRSHPQNTQPPHTSRYI